MTAVASPKLYYAAYDSASAQYSNVWCSDLYTVSGATTCDRCTISLTSCTSLTPYINNWYRIWLERASSSSASSCTATYTCEFSNPTCQETTGSIGFLGEYQKSTYSCSIASYTPSSISLSQHTGIQTFTYDVSGELSCDPLPPTFYGSLRRCMLNTLPTGVTVVEG